VSNVKYQRKQALRGLSCIDDRLATLYRLSGTHAPELRDWYAGGYEFIHQLRRALTNA
jgi:hypothetical protein